MAPRVLAPQGRRRVGIGPLLAATAVLALATGCTRGGDERATTAASVASTSPAGSTPIATITPAATTTSTGAPVDVTAFAVPTAPPTTTPPTTTPAPVTAAAPTTQAPPGAVDGEPRYVVPVADVAAAGWADEHHDYPATDVFVGCGADIVSPVDGALLEVRREDRYDAAVDDPATRGGRSVSILGDDGVRYYLAHLDTIDEPLVPGARVAAGEHLATMGRTGRASACHVHVAISPPCPGTEWSVRRGVVWPYPYLDAWRDGEQRSPVDEVAAWSAAHPTACADAIADPNAPHA